jgi:regulator of protease activity HflC (stomatin/prohibitin superfamily)
MQEKVVKTMPGMLMLVVSFLLLLFGLFVLIGGRMPVIGVPTILIAILTFAGLFSIQPNTARVMQLFGSYVGTAKEEGLRWANPFYTKQAVSLRARNFESAKLKVNELEGSPIEIGAIIVWQVVDSAQAVFQVDDYASFVHIQSEAALRNLATHYPYDAHETGQISLRTHSHEVAELLKKEVQDKLMTAGVQVTDARISHLAFAPEIAHAMLQRQQANAVIAARTKIVEGAVSMVEMALDQLSKRGVVHLDEERKAAMVSNLLVVLCGDRGTQPVVNTGSLYS